MSVVMNVEKKNYLLSDFADSFLGMNFIVIQSARSFKLEENEQLSLELLEEMFKASDSSRHIDGTLEASRFEDAATEINDVLGYQATWGGGIERCSNEELARRQKIFWDIVQSQISLPPAKTYEHVAFHGSRLSFGIHWNFCYIFMNGNEGFAIAMGASD